MALHKESAVVKKGCASAPATHSVDLTTCKKCHLCAEICPAVFAMADDGLAYVKQDGVVLAGGFADALADVPESEEDGVAEAAEACPGECIFITE